MSKKYLFPTKIPKFLENNNFDIAELRQYYEKYAIQNEFIDNNKNNIQQGEKPLSKYEELGNIIKEIFHKNENYFFPRLIDKNQEIYWKRQKQQIAYKNKAKISSVFNEKSLGSSSPLTKSTKNIQQSATLPKKEASQPIIKQLNFISQFAGANNKENQPQNDVENISFSSSEYDIYAPKFEDENEISDDNFIEKVMEDTKKLKLKINDDLNIDQTLSNSMSITEFLPRFISENFIENSISDDIEENCKPNKVYTSQTNANSQIKSTTNNSVLIKSVPCETIENINAKTFYQSKDPTPKQAEIRLKTVASVKKLEKTRNRRGNVTDCKTSAIGCYKNIPKKQNKLLTKGISPRNKNVKSSLNYESVIARNKAGIPIPIFIQSVVEHKDYSKTLHGFAKSNQTTNVHSKNISPKKSPVKLIYSPKTINEIQPQLVTSNTYKNLKTEVSSPRKFSVHNSKIPTLNSFSKR